jgi:hypothetical protein
MKVRDHNFSLETHKAQLRGENSLIAQKRELALAEARQLLITAIKNSPLFKFLLVTF